ncbi:MAG: hypothetical protein A3I43_04265 [Omnitrophica WOR_2 bacterium RIFCSPLOWO2_02_FULL_50_19]|nr:MAG: hypothetical protein A3I43_04265 [Omnitrophica WOR_2 bacterium RIFCSPLOWO2_02_FULL_50_19]
MKTKKVALIITAALLMSSLKVFAFDPSPAGKLEVMVAVSASPEYIKEWTASHYNQPITIKTVGEIKQNQVVYASAIVSGFGVTEKGGVDLSGDFILLDPNGKMSLEQKDIFHVKMEKGQAPGGFIMLDPALDLMVEESDPEGVYILKAVVRDNVLGKTASGEYKLSYKKQATGAISKTGGFSSIDDFGKWMTYYYVEPEPQKISSAIKFYSDSSLYDKEDTRLSTAAFFAVLFKKDNELMKRSFDDVSATGSENAKLVLLNALYLVNNEGSRALIKKADAEWRSEYLKKVIEKVASSPAPDIFAEPVRDGEHLDMLWTTFLATGDEEPVRKIISALHLLEDGHGMEIAVGGAARWSLISNALQHKIVYQACKEELARSEGKTKKIPEEIISEVDKRILTPQNF